MAEILILGSGFAVPNAEHENTHMLLRTAQRTVLVDCASNPMQRLPEAGVDFDEITDIILTHFHPDHVSGLPILLMGMWLSGRIKPINLYGLSYTISRTRTMMDLFDWQNWPGFYEVNFISLEEEENQLVLEDESIRILASPVKHLIPTIGIRAEFLPENKSMTYSCDTEPCEQVVRLAGGADILIHEAAGNSKGHSSASQAAETALKAAAGSLYLIHYPTGHGVKEKLLKEASEIFSKDVFIAEDFLVLKI